jgi:hypothetical protein
MRTTTILTGILIVVPSLAAAETDIPALEPERPDVFLTPPTSEHIMFARQMLPATNPVSTSIAAVAQSRVIYLNRTGVTLTPGNNDSRTNKSSIVKSTSTVPAWNTSAANWAATVTCMKDMFSRWDVVVTDVNPGNVPHIEAVFGGSPQNIGMQAGVGGVSPFTQNCAVIENSIVFTFTNVFPDNPQTICEVMAQEVAHSFGLDHQMLASDPMTYLSYNGKRTFKDQTVPCGEYQNRQCGIGGSVCRPNQNSVQLLTERLGIADAVAPTMTITFPKDGASVEPGFEVTATAMDNVAVTQAKLLVDGAVVATTQGAGPYTFPTDAMLAMGAHSVEVEVTDGKNVQSQTINVTVVTPGGGDDTGSGSGSGGGNGGGGNGGGGTGGGGDDDGGIDVDNGGGCSSGRDVGFACGLFLLAHMMIRRRRYI